MGPWDAPRHGSGETKKGCSPSEVASSSPAHPPPERLPGDFFLQPPTSMSNHFLIPAGPERGDNEISKPLARQSILWLQAEPSDSAGSQQQELAQATSWLVAVTPPWGPHSTATTAPGATPETPWGSEETKQRGEQGDCGRDGLLPSHRGLWGAAAALPGLCHTWHAAAGSNAWLGPAAPAGGRDGTGKPFPPRPRALRHLRSDQDPLQPRARRLKPASAPRSASDFELRRWSCSQLLRSHSPARSYSWRWKRLCGRTGPHARLGDRR